MYRTCTVRSPFRRLYLSCEVADLDRERVPPASLPVTGVRQSAGGDLSSPHSYSIPIVFAVPFQLNECGRLSASTLGFICKCSGALSAAPRLRSLTLKINTVNRHSWSLSIQPGNARMLILSSGEKEERGTVVRMEFKCFTILE